MVRPKGSRDKKPRETIRRKRLLKATVKAIKDKKVTSMQDLAVEAGMSKNSRQMYSNSTKQYIAQKLDELGYSLDDCRDFFLFLRKTTLNKEDFKEARANNENLTRMLGGFKDVTKSDITVKDSTKAVFDEIDRRRYVEEEE